MFALGNDDVRNIVFHISSNKCIALMLDRSVPILVYGAVTNCITK